MKEIIIIILLLIIVIQLHLSLKRKIEIINILNYLKSGLFGNGNGAMSKLSNLDYINSKLDKIFKEPKIKYAGLEDKNQQEK